MHIRDILSPQSNYEMLFEAFRGFSPLCVRAHSKIGSPLAIVTRIVTVRKIGTALILIGVEKKS